VVGAGLPVDTVLPVTGQEPISGHTFGPT